MDGNTELLQGRGRGRGRGRVLPPTFASPGTNCEEETKIALGPVSVRYPRGRGRGILHAKEGSQHLDERASSFSSESCVTVIHVPSQLTRKEEIYPRGRGRGILHTKGGEEGAQHFDEKVSSFSFKSCVTVIHVPVPSQLTRKEEILGSASVISSEEGISDDPTSESSGPEEVDYVDPLFNCTDSPDLDTESKILTFGKDDTSLDTSFERKRRSSRNKQASIDWTTIRRYHEYPASFSIPKPSQRLQNLQNADVKLLRRVQGTKDQFYVAFHDRLSVVRFGELVKKMSGYYSSSLIGWPLRKPANALLVDEVVAASVNDPSGMFRIRRVKILRLNKIDEERFTAFCEDIDSLDHWTITQAFCLVPAFRDYPGQVCKLQIRNYDKVYIRKFLQSNDRGEEILLSRQDRRRVEGILVEKIFSSMIGQTIRISNITRSEDPVEFHFAGDFDLKRDFRLKPLFIEAFTEHVNPKTPQIGATSEGIMTYASHNGCVGICLETSLYHQVMKLVNEPWMHLLAESVTAEDKEALIDKIFNLNCRYCIVQDEKYAKFKFHRVTIVGYDIPKLLVIYMESGESKVITFDDLVCSIVNNPKVPQILTLIPPQALYFRTMDCKDISVKDTLEHFPQCVKFQVIENSRLPNTPPIVKLLKNP